jgi:serine/threonine-protein kinase HipA
MKVTVFLWDHRLGFLSDDIPSRPAAFEFAPDYDGPSPSPFYLSRKPGLIFPSTPLRGLHGAFYDSLPDTFGEAAMDQWFRQKGINPEGVTSLQRLSYVGARGFGALRYEPDQGAEHEDFLMALHDIALARAARETVAGDYHEILPQFLKAASSPGGARPKVTIGINPENSDEILLGDWRSATNYEPWLLKIDVAPGRQYGRIEHAFLLMAREAGLRTTPSRIITEEREGITYSHYAVKRFDRAPDGPIHIHSLAALLERDFNRNETTYEELLVAAKRLTGNIGEAEEFLRRGIFNYAVANCDDHAKNHAFTMNRSGIWQASPVYDLTPSKGEGQRGLHAMGLGIGYEAPNEKTWVELGESVGIPAARTKEHLRQVQHALKLWPEIAAASGVSTARAMEVADGFAMP